MPTTWNNLLNLFFPNLCKICKRPLVEGEEQICLKCLCDLPHTGYHQLVNNPVEQLFIGKNRIEYATAYLRYEKGGKVQSLIHSLKYHDNKELGYLLGRQIARELQADHSPICTVDLLIPVPLHPRKKTAKRLQPVRMDRLRHPFHMGYPHRYAKSSPHHPHKYPNS